MEHANDNQPRAYYNEIDQFAAQWLRNLIAAGHIAPGDVDERSIVDVRPADLAGYTQCHFFAGIGIWSAALRGSGWPDSAEVWTGSCPCQPFSSAGKRGGTDDERHLWPAFQWLIQQCRPVVVFGEQVASKDGLGWLDTVSTDLEAMGYAIGAIPFPAAGIGAPHIRQRLYWAGKRLANSDECGQPGSGLVGRSSNTATAQNREVDRIVDASGSRGLADSARERRNGSENPALPAGRDCSQDSGSIQRLANDNSTGLGARGQATKIARQGHTVESASSDDRHGPASPTNGFWGDADWLFCRDGKWRPVESGTFPLAHGIAQRVGRLRAYGNGIVKPQAEAFITAYLETENDTTTTKREAS